MHSIGWDKFVEAGAAILMAILATLAAYSGARKAHDDQVAKDAIGKKELNEHLSKIDAHLERQDVTSKETLKKLDEHSKAFDDHVKAFGAHVDRDEECFKEVSKSLKTVAAKMTRNDRAARVSREKETK